MSDKVNYILFITKQSQMWTQLFRISYSTNLAFLSDDVIALCWQAGIPLDSDFA